MAPTVSVATLPASSGSAPTGDSAPQGGPTGGSAPQRGGQRSLDGVDTALAGLGHLGIGEGPVGGLEAQRECEAAPPVRHGSAPEHVEQRQVHEQPTSGGPEAGAHVGRRRRLIHLERQVDVRGRIAAHRPVGPATVLKAEQGLQVQLLPSKLHPNQTLLNWRDICLNLLLPLQNDQQKLFQQLRPKKQTPRTFFYLLN